MRANVYHRLNHTHYACWGHSHRPSHIHDCLNQCALYNVIFVLAGILTQRWTLLKKPMMGLPVNIERKVGAMTVLHNYLLINHDRSYLPPGVADMINGSDEGGQNGIWRQEAGLPQAEATQQRNWEATASAVRNVFVEYFNGPGTVPWQQEMLARKRPTLP
jgi:hypothetical protein